MEVTFNETQLHLLINYSLRYAVGKNSEIISEYIHTMCLNWDTVPNLTKTYMIQGLGQQIQFHFNVLEERQRNNKDLNEPTNLGVPIDADSWIRFYNFMVRKQEEHEKIHSNV